jgi:hypothetical protein
VGRREAAERFRRKSLFPQRHESCCGNIHFASSEHSNSVARNGINYPVTLNRGHPRWTAKQSIAENSASEALSAENVGKPGKMPS